ncbi:hypothetical protein [Leucobacter sp. cx-169]|uniref:hypothetical protein n=1 Tax=Leucobacter sp. cx-169 TaxID=2770549 RepID=UPI00165DB601|nr:hypothetical protein [Leucobacter sp. cx-169]MBC9927192.1 hypothetical protein [Leucobacter sp. cx-169]
MSSFTERDLLNRLGVRYSNIRRGTLADRWVRAEHVRRRLGHASMNYVADFIALDKYPGIPYGTALAMHWFEVKVSRSDWLAELRQPEKSEAFTRFANHAWLVVSDASIVKPGELPDGWGLLVAAGAGLRAKVAAPRVDAEPVPFDLTISIAAAAQRTGARELAHRDAATAHIDYGVKKCSACGKSAPCRWHQPRAFGGHRASLE